MMGKLLPQRFTTATGLAAMDLPRSSLAKCSRTSKPVNRLGLGRRGCCWWTGPSMKCRWWALHVLRRLDFIARVARDRCVPFGDMQVVFARDFFRFPPVPNAEDDWWFCFRSPLWPVIIPAAWYCPRSIARKTLHSRPSFVDCEWVWCWRGVHAWAFEAGCDSHQR